MTLRQRVEEAFGAWGEIVWRWRWATIVVMVALAAGLGSRLPYVKFDPSIENWLRDDDPVKIAYDHFRERFGRDRLVMLAIEPPEIFDLEFLDWLRHLPRPRDEHSPPERGDEPRQRPLDLLNVFLPSATSPFYPGPSSHVPSTAKTRVKTTYALLG